YCGLFGDLCTLDGTLACCIALELECIPLNDFVGICL
uniref:Asteropin-A n=1 Tax=Asteropus simplex TaxID=350939 RepID=ASTAE_ASTSM|nr:RecName: Full=Asteropin-A; AltName: Full=Asteropine-A [Asteropus simplex]